MKRMGAVTLIVLAVIAAAVFAAATYTVDERERALVLRFGQVIRYNDTPGLHFKTPFVDTVRYYDRRILTLDAEPAPVLTAEKKKVLVDAYVKWRIDDLLKFYTSVGGSEFEARSRLAQLLNSGLREEIGKRTLRDVVSEDRRKVMEAMSEQMDRRAGEYGVSVIDVRVQRVDLTPEVSQSVYDRMKAERARVAKELRAQGAEAAEKIRADADRQREVLLAEAYRDAQRLRGEGDGRATQIYAGAYSKDPEFFALYRSLNAYKESFKDKSDVLVVDPSSDFFRYMKRPNR